MLIQRGQSTSVPESYADRRAEIANQATGVDGVPVRVSYTAEEQQTWAGAQSLLEPLWERYAALPLRSARHSLDLPTGHIPQLALVSERLRLLTGWRYASVPGTVPGADFFAALAERIFPSTQFIRWSGAPDYTPQPDVLHEIGGHAISLANPKLAELHQLAGRAAVAQPGLITAIASVFWYSIEFGVVASRDGWKAYGTGLLSSPGELGWFAEHAQVRPLNIAEMISTPYDITRYQPVLFGADSLDAVLEVVGGFYDDVIHDHEMEGLTNVSSQKG